MESNSLKTAIFVPNWVGDACMATPALKAIAAHPGYRDLTLVGRYAPIAVLEGVVDAESIVYKPRSKQQDQFSRLGLARELRRRRFECAILLPNSLSTAMIAVVAGIRRRVGYSRGGRGWLLTDRISAVGWKDVPVIDAYLNIAQHLGCSIESRRMMLPITPEDLALSDRMLAGFNFDRSRPLILVNNGSAVGTARLIPNERWHAILGSLSRDFNVVIHCGPKDRESANAAERIVGSPVVRSMGNEKSFPFGLSKGIIARSDLVVSSDSGLRHMAVALDKQVVSFFGPTAPALTRTYNQPELLIEQELPCRPCYKTECPLGHRACLADIQTERVADAVRSLIQQ
jgi:heptosyltransferase II